MIFLLQRLVSRSFCWQSLVLFYLLRIFTPVIAGRLSLVSEWQQVSSGHLHSSKYSSWSQQFCSLNGLDSSIDFQIYQAFSQDFETVPSTPTATGITVTPIFHSSFSSLAKSMYLFIFLLSYFHSVIRQWGKIHKTTNSLFFILFFFFFIN